MAAPSKAQWTAAIFSASAVAVGCALLRRRRRALQATVTQLVVYPVKSCRGIELEQVELDAGGIVHDREWMIVWEPPAGSDSAKFDMVTIREMPRMATIQPSITSQGKLMLSTDDGKSIVVENDTHGAECKSIVWRSEVTGVDQGNAVSAFLTAFLECSDRPVRLIRMQPAARRLMACHKYNPVVASSDDQGGSSRFSDWSQLSIISNQSLAWLNSQDSIGGGMSNRRFRMNIVVDASQAFAEDTWDTYSIGEVSCQFLKRCGRCAVPTVDPIAGIKDKSIEPLKTLKRLRRGEYPFLVPGTDTQAFLGVNMRHMYTPGQRIRVGDRVAVTRQNGSWFS